MSVINTNIMSLVAQQNLKESQSSLTQSMERLSSGLRINSASDDAAGQAIANRFTSQVNGLNQAQRNANDGISMAQTTEGSLNQINDNLQTIRTLTVQALNGSNSQSDLESIQDEIDQRLSEIDRISAETDFNGSKVLAEGTEGLRIQVGANDDQIIDINLRQIDVTSLDLNGFNVDGSSATDNREATITDLIAAGASDEGNNLRDHTVTHDKATLNQVIEELSEGDTVHVSGGTTYTYDAAAGNFTFTDSISGSGGIAELADDLTPNSGTVEGTYEFESGHFAEFEVQADGNLTIDGNAAYISDAGFLTTNSSGGTQATLTDLLADDTGDGTNQFVEIDGTRYTLSGGGNGVSFENTATTADVLAAAEDAPGDYTAVTLSDGLTTNQIDFNKDLVYSGGGSHDGVAFSDRNGDLTTVEEFTTRYEVNPDDGTVTVVGVTEGDSFDANERDFQGTDVDLQRGEVAYINSDGLLTTAETSAGDATEDPLATLDSAIANVDSLRSELGAVQNRFTDAITNLNTVSTNLSDARSRIEDADYAVEVANMTRAQILQQAGTSVLAQANQIPQNVLSLLG
ncbi:MAG: flagellin [Halochromatium sp.]|uniref:flagellin N-terminal helical domain-containing protein n=1 Tax=Halochromatium sp. TaxID=2049430 RepID=UPI00397D6DF2